MGRRDSFNGWGPSHQGPPPPSWHRLARNVAVFIGCVWLSVHALGLLIVLAMIIGALRLVCPRLNRLRARRVPGRRASDVRLADVRTGTGVYLGEGRDAKPRVAPAEHGVLLVGPPRSGKTSAVIIPSVLSHVGPIVSTSTKPDVLTATARRRGEVGRVWEFDPTGHATGVGAERLRWSPVTTAGSWDMALTTARAMVAGARVGAGTTDASHWSKRATGLLAALLHAAALDDTGIGGVCEWVAHHELTAPGVVLERSGAGAACRLLAGLANTEARERSSIVSAAQDALDAYSSDAALAAGSDPNFDVPGFVQSDDTVYIHAPAEDQRLVAPLICGLLSEIRRATYTAARAGRLTHRVLWALDEAANIAPLDELPAIASEGGGQGLTLLASFQDLSQARERWGRAADGFLTLFGTKLVLPGVADPGTLEAVSVTLGEYDRRVRTDTWHPQQGSGLPWPSRGHSIATQRQRVLSPGEVANIPARHALHLRGVRWELVRLTPAHVCEPWRSLITPSATVSEAAWR